jgi:voltage-gated potassium channel
MSPRRLGELTPHERRRAVVASLARCIVSFAAIITLYFVLPLSDRSVDANAVVTLVVGAALFVAVLWWQFRRVIRAELPQLQAFEAVIVAVPLFVVIYSATYLVMSHLNHASFTERLDHTSSLYFTVVTLGTVGYGDIAPRTHVARLIVTSQVLLDLALLALLVRAFVEVTRRRLSGNQSDPPSATNG